MEFFKNKIPNIHASRHYSHWCTVPWATVFPQKVFVKFLSWWSKIEKALALYPEFRKLVVEGVVRVSDIEGRTRTLSFPALMEFQSVPESYFSFSYASNTMKTKQIVLTLEMFVEAENKLVMGRIRRQYSDL